MDYGNGWSGSDWRVPSFTTFDAHVTGGGKTEPTVSAGCPACGVDADVAVAYGK